MLVSHQVFTTYQLTDLAFDSPITARHRLAVLTELGVVARLSIDSSQRARGVPTQGVYTLDAVGAVVAGLIDTDDLPRWRPERASALAHSPRLAHLLGVNGFFTALAREARHVPERRLHVWWSEHRCLQATGGLARPDGFGVWSERGRGLSFFLEYDRGTETRRRLDAKLSDYTRLTTRLDQAPPWVLFAFTSGYRDRHLRPLLARTDLPVATAVVAPGASPAEAIWHVPGHSDTGPLRLAELPAAHPSGGEAA